MATENKAGAKGAKASGATAAKSAKGSGKKNASKKSKGAKKAEAKPTTKYAGNSDLLAGTPGPGPKVGDSAYTDPETDRRSTGREAPLSDGLSAGPKPPTEKGGDSKARAIAGKVKMGDIVAFITGGRNPGKVRPAIVIREVDPELENSDENRIDLSVFPDAGRYPNNDHLPNPCYREGIRYSEGLEHDTWHFREDTDKLLKEKLEGERGQIEAEQEQANDNRRSVAKGRSRSDR